MNPFQRFTELLFIGSLMRKYKFTYRDVKEALRIYDNMRKAKSYRKIVKELKGIGDVMDPDK